MATLEVSFSKISNEELDALSSDDEDDSDDEYVAPPPLSSLATGGGAAAKRKTQLEDFAGFEDGADMDDPIAKQMQAVLSLRLCLNMDSDKEFMKEQEAKKAEREKLASMSVEERLAYQEKQAGSVLSNVASKYDLDDIKKRRAARSASGNLEKPATPSPKECDATASESGSLSDEADARSVENEEHGESKEKRKKKESKSKDKKKREDSGEKKKKDSKSKDKKPSEKKKEKSSLVERLEKTLRRLRKFMKEDQLS